MKPFTTIPPRCLRSAVTQARGQTRLASPAPRRARCTPGSIRGVLAAVALFSGCDGPTEPGELNARRVLTVLYRELDGPNWDNNDKWLTRAPVSKWYGVEVDAGGNVIALHLQRNGLAGELPRELGSLRTLEVLRLDAKEPVITTGPTTDDTDDKRVLTGSIPPELGNLRFLRYLSLTRNGLVGTIPPELGNLRNLEYLNLTLSGVTGSLPPELGSLRNLKVLRLALNRLTGSLPPELGNLQNLEELILYSNGLTGSIPSELGNLRHLVRMFLGSNELTGPIPPEFGNLQNIESLSIAGARLLTGSIPPELGSLQNLDFLNLEDNASMSGRLPLELIGVPLEVFRWNGTDMCAPRDDAFREWLASIRYHQGGRNCPG